MNWNFALDGPVPGKQDFISTAVHEIGHVLGIGTAAIYNIQRDGDGFAGPNARAVNDGAPVPLEPDGHVQDGLRGNTVLMDPTNRQGQRKTPTEIDLAMLADIGYEIAGFEAQGAALPLATEAGETIFGSEIADRLAGLGGADRIIAGRGDDTLSGGAGEDSLFGGDGADSFRLAPGEGLVRVLDFEFGIDRLLLSADLGIEDAAGLLAAAARPFTNVTDIALGQGTTLRVFHEDATQTPLRVSDFAFEAETGITGSAFADTLAGGDGADRISAGAGDDAILASGGADVIEGGSGVDRALYALPRAALAPDLAEDGSVTLAAPGGTDRLSGVERIATLDGVFLYDIAAEPAALAHRLFAAAFDRLPAEAGLRFWTAALASGTPAEAVAAEFAASAEFAALFGAAADDRGLCDGAVRDGARACAGRGGSRALDGGARIRCRDAGGPAARIRGQPGEHRPHGPRSREWRFRVGRGGCVVALTRMVLAALLPRSVRRRGTGGGREDQLGAMRSQPSGGASTARRARSASGRGTGRRVCASTWTWVKSPAAAAVCAPSAKMARP